MTVRYQQGLSFRVRPSVLLNRTFRVLTRPFSLLWVRPSVFWPSPSRSFLFELDLPCLYSAFLIFLSRIFSILTQSFPFLSQSFGISRHSSSLFESVLPDFEGPTFWANLFLFFDSDLPFFNNVSPSHFLGQSFLYFLLPLSPFFPFCILIWSPRALLTKLKMEVCAGSIYCTTISEKLK